jgi:hypothetical protein
MIAGAEQMVSNFDALFRQRNASAPPWKVKVDLKLEGHDPGWTYILSEKSPKMYPNPFCQIKCTFF